MIRQRRFRVGVVLSSLAALVVSGCAAVQSGSMIGSGDVVADRQRLMKLNGANWKDIQAKGKAGDIKAIAVNAETLALNAEHIPALFPKGSLTDKSKAKPEIWQQWDQFKRASKNLETWAVRLRDAASDDKADEAQAIIKDFGKEACGGCHTPFRVPPKK